MSVYKILEKNMSDPIFLSHLSTKTQCIIKIAKVCKLVSYLLIRNVSADFENYVKNILNILDIDGYFNDGICCRGISTLPSMINYRTIIKNIFQGLYNKDIYNKSSKDGELLEISLSNNDIYKRDYKLVEILLDVKSTKQIKVENIERTMNYMCDMSFPKNIIDENITIFDHDHSYGSLLYIKKIYEDVGCTLKSEFNLLPKTNEEDIKKIKFTFILSFDKDFVLNPYTILEKESITGRGFYLQNLKKFKSEILEAYKSLKYINKFI